MKKNVNLLENTVVLMGISVLGSILIWAMVVYNIDTILPMTVSNVPVTLNVQDSNLLRLDLHPVTDGQFSVDVEVSGPRAIVGNIKPEELQATAKLNNITGPGTYNLPIEIVDSRNRDIEILSSLPDTISMRFDYMVTKKIDIELETSGLEIADGYLLDKERIYPNSITVTGPASDLQAVDSAVIIREFDEDALSNSMTEELPIILRTVEGERVNSPYLQLERETATVTLPVLKKVTIPVVFDYTNIPDGFDTSTLSYRIFPEKVEVAGPIEQLDSFREVHLGYVDLRTLEPDTSLYYRMKLPADFVSVENNIDATVTFLSNGIDSTNLSVKSEGIYIRNLPEQYEATVQTRSINDVKVYGPQDIVSKLSNQDVIAEIDMTNVEITLGQVTVPASILIPSHSECWAYGDHYVARITVREK